MFDGLRRDLLVFTNRYALGSGEQVMRIFLSLLLALCILPPTASGQSTCPSNLDSPKARANLQRLFYTEEFALAREQHDLPAKLDSTSVHLLTDAQDRSVCQVLAQKVHSDPGISQAPWRSVFYKAGGWYFVVSLMYPLEQYEIRIVNNKLSGTFYFVPVDVYDASLSLVAGWNV